MSEKLFRKKSLDKIASPESLTDYIRVTNPGVWLVLAALIVLLAGACVWAIFGRMETKLPVRAKVENGRAAITLTADEAASVLPGMKVLYEGGENEILSVEGPDENGLYTAVSSFDISDGTVQAEIVTESVSPMSFIVN